ncbi:lactoylglutathione lyase [filamentous cyanobacterium LEGE 11480]|uniref:Aldoketomutase n=1 Tax=Romeriopsis navalis LEGE 11480 TaxID=2777977 RepID=A0A928VJC8_9CYAN|nr:VOC family protein [Romeriopsis navalis]MBE9029698.1 lactoylglutathione lyase [Romeriopsis navalis LEGE 11480]
MTTPIPATVLPKRILYTMIRVSNLEDSIAFYQEMLGISELGRETFPEAKFTAVFMGYGDRTTHPVIELTYNWGDNSYEHGTRYGNLSLAVNDVYALEAHLKERGVEILRPAGVLPIASTETGTKHTLAFIADPDGYRVELMQSI